ncbi:MAG: preprotein translocase subunit YajC [Bacteroidales bacterium]|jgi:preprotein translocase subunit YajC|nr:preprotein translocase subunit YajC [Bacteroidales bacterium]MBP5134506.1 preprotein translocase subunit YajC [Paludibacteraceae bacterium]MBR6309720.1 preprotein translocase subunit YajC [Paludibacteraceae bacterium]MDD6357461.1 preprotein translocase subunit YajC [Bacteroidales bacterium]
MNNLTILLQAQAQGGIQQYSGIIMFALIFLVFWLFMIRPQQKKQKEIQKAREAIKAGDKVITSGGIYAKVKEVKENAFILEIAENVRIKIDKNSVYACPEDLENNAK